MLAPSRFALPSTSAKNVIISIYLGFQSFIIENDSRKNFPMIKAGTLEYRTFAPELTISHHLLAKC